MPRRPPIPPSLAELELEVMEHLWPLGEATVRELMDASNAGRPKPRAYTTYLTIMSRLDEKGVVERRRSGKTDIYRPVGTATPTSPSAPARRSTRSSTSTATRR